MKAARNISRVSVPTPSIRTRLVPDNTGVKVAVGLSGGVDSSLAAALLVEQGYDVTGVHLVCYEEPGCRAPQDRKDALAVALQLGIPLEVLDFQREYKEKVIEYFYREYKAGRTPNPDVVCNREIKFGLFLDWALEHGFDFVATGHYARIRERVGHGIESEKKRQGASLNDINLTMSDRHELDQGVDDENLALFRGIDSVKDQSYFLYTLTQRQLRHILFPIGNLTKKEVRLQAKKRGLVTAEKPDSVGICFVGDVDVQEFLRRRIKEKPGDVVDTDGNVIGEHKGVWFYTIGQRHGFRISNKSQVTSNKLNRAIPPFYVVGKDVSRNRLIVGFGPETYVDQFPVKDLHFVNGIGNRELVDMGDLRVRIRHGGELIPATLENSKFEIRNSKFLVRLGEPVRGISPGQAAVFYKGRECLGGGVIGEVEP